MPNESVWTMGCDACGAEDPVEYVSPIGYLCAFCRRKESIQSLLKEMRDANDQV
jgi:hypothetical protein